ncbi:MAG: hypothetical protein AAF244_03450 [Pseudomonadota bacterium]
MSDYLQSVEGFDTYKVKIIRDVLIDEARSNRPVKIKIYYPEDCEGEQKLPVVCWSHGLGGGADGAAFLARYISEHGYVVVNMQHHGTDTTIWEGKPGHPWDVIRATEITRDMTLNRYRDVPFVLDSLPEFLVDYQDVARMADLSTIGMSGHSFGALTTQVNMGMLFPNEKNELASFSDSRFKAAIAYSPGDISHLGDFDEAQAYGAIDRPILHMTGTEDKSPLTNEGYELRLKAYQGSSDKEGKHLLVIKDADHMVFVGSRGKLGASKNREKHENIIKTFALAYWDAMLKEDEAAKDWLKNEAQNWLNGEGSFK